MLPWPPSLNRLWRYGRGRVYRSKVYKQWIKAADDYWLMQKPRQKIKQIKGPFQIELILIPPNNRARDQDNHSKAVLDWAQRVEIIENDALCRDSHVYYGEGKEPGVRLIVKALDKES